MNLPARVSKQKYLVSDNYTNTQFNKYTNKQINK